MKVIATICRKDKRKVKGKIAARKLYLDPDGYFQLVGDYAEQENFPFWIISGKYGFISGDDMIEYYGTKITEDRIPEMTEMVSKQLVDSGIETIYFYPDKPGRVVDNWAYYKVLKQACDNNAIELIVRELTELHR